MLREAENLVTIQGILSELDIHSRSFKDATNADVPYIGGQITIRVHSNDQIFDVPVDVFAKKYKNDGMPNPAYTNLEDIMNNSVSIAACGNETEADKLRITTGRIIVNHYLRNNGEMASMPKISTSFVRKITTPLNEEYANFSLEFFLAGISAVVDKDGVEVEPKKLEVRAIFPMYGGKVEEVKLHSTNPNVINAIEHFWEVGKSYKVNGRLNFTQSTQEIVTEVDFGEPQKTYKTISSKEFVITGGSQTPLEADFEFKAEDIKTGMAELATRIEDAKQKALQKTKSGKSAATTTNNNGLDLGF